LVLHPSESRSWVRIAILTSGWDTPGTNAAVRAVARTAFLIGLQAMKVGFDYKGLLEGDISPIDRRKLEGIIGRGGTVLGTERSKEFQRRPKSGEPPPEGSRHSP
jgi:6-phosphofructokinase 1